MKGQFWSFDIVFAIVLFVFTIVLLTFVWINISSEFSTSAGANVQHLEIQLQALTNQLTTQGTPSNWDSIVNLNAPGTWQNISVGLGNGTTGILSQNKVNTLQTMANTNYQATKPALGIAYDYYITVTGNGINIAIGVNPAKTNVTSLHVISQPALLNGHTVQVQTELWSNSTLGIV